MLNVKGLLLTVSLVISSQLNAATISEITQVNFGDVVPKAGSCVMNPTTAGITPSTLCTTTGTLGVITISSTANTTIRVRAISTLVAPYNLTFEPTIRLTNDQGDSAIHSIPGTYINFDTGNDGLITVYASGTLGFPGNLNFGTSYSVTFDLQAIEL